MTSLDRLFKPRSIAVVGASRNPRKIGHLVLRNILEFGFRGRVYPVNPNATTILGLRCYKRVSEIPDEVDVVVVAVPAEKVPGVLRDAGEAGVPFAVIISAGFGEIGRRDLEEELLRVARKYGIRIVGPNVAGILYAPWRLNATFGPSHVLEGDVAFVTQSGAYAIALMGLAETEGLGLSAVVSVGNKIDLDDADFIEYLGEDPNTRVILAYIEGVRDGRRLASVIQRVALRKPVIIIKAGRTEVGAKAAMSHTGSLAGSYRMFETIMSQHGALVIPTMEAAFDAAKALDWNPHPRGDRVVIVTNGGGAGVQAVDTLVEKGVEVKPLERGLRERLEKILPSFASTRNPVDLTGGADSETFHRVLVEVLTDPSVDAVVVLYTQTRVAPPLETAKAILDAINEAGRSKPVTVGLLGGPECVRAARTLSANRVPAYPAPERAALAMAAVIAYHRLRLHLEERLAELGVKP